MIEGSVLIEVAQEEPDTDGLHPEDDKEEPDGGQEEELTHHPHWRVSTAATGGLLRATCR
ncbi:UNVERIFIED_CONTAM: hypothetical protein FKN15_073667 [Acipenser sinensis]